MGINDSFDDHRYGTFLSFFFLFFFDCIVSYVVFVA